MHDRPRHPNPPNVIHKHLSVGQRQASAHDDDGHWPNVQMAEPKDISAKICGPDENMTDFSPIFAGSSCRKQTSKRKALATRSNSMKQPAGECICIGGICRRNDAFVGQGATII